MSVIKIEGGAKELYPVPPESTFIDSIPRELLTCAVNSASCEAPPPVTVTITSTL